ncbi:Ubiquitin-conjugating enzyme E2 6 [Rhodosporidiobolus nylandii]
MASKVAAKRLQKEFKALQAAPPPFIDARPNESNILEWHYLFRGPPETPYAGGEYWGTVVFTKDYPFAPPELRMLTPSGRFTPNTAICTSMSNFHPGSWNVSWSVETILVGLMSFMLSEEITTGATKATDAERKQLSDASHEWNLKQPKFKTIWPEYATKEMRDPPNMTGGAPAPAGPQGEGVKPSSSQ